MSFEALVQQAHLHLPTSAKHGGPSMTPPSTHVTPSQPASPTPYYHKSAKAAKPQFPAYGKAKLQQVFEKKQKAKVSHCLWDEQIQESVSDIPLSTQEKEWIEEEEQERKYNHMLNEIQHIKTSQDKILQNQSVMMQEIAEIKEEITQIANRAIEVLDQPEQQEINKQEEDAEQQICSSINSQVLCCNQINSLQDNEMVATEVWLKMPGYQQFLVDAILDTGSSFLLYHKEISPSRVYPSTREKGKNLLC